MHAKIRHQSPPVNLTLTGYFLKKAKCVDGIGNIYIYIICHIEIYIYIHIDATNYHQLPQP